MENPSSSPLGSGTSIPITIAQGAVGTSQQQATSKQFRLNISNQNFILVPASASGNLTAAIASSGHAAANVTNLIATHQNSPMNKGKIMILTPGPNVAGNSQFVAASVSTVAPASVTSTDVVSDKQVIKSELHQTYQLLTSAGQIVSPSSNHILTASKPLTPISITRNSMPLNQSRPHQAEASQPQPSTPMTSSVITLISSNNQTQEQEMSQSPVQSSYHHHHPNIILNGTAHNLDLSKFSDTFDVSESTYLPLPQQAPTSKQQKKQQYNTGVISLDELTDLANDHDIEIDELKQLDSIETFRDSSDFHLPGNSKQKSISMADAKELLYSDEKLDRDSPELWPEQVPGVINFISGSFPIVDEFEDDSLHEIFQSGQGQPIQPAPGGAGISCGDSGLGSGCSDSASVKKYSRTFDFTGYGLASSIPERSRNGSGGSDSEERESPTSVNGGNCESNENSSRASPVDGFASQSSLMDTAIPSTSKVAATMAASVKTVVQAAHHGKPKTPVKASHVPDWQRDLDEEEVAMLYGYGSLTTSALLDKVKEIQNLAYQLGLEEEREMARARFLNVLGDCRASERLNGGLFLSKNDLVFAESKTLNSTTEQPDAQSSTKTPVRNGTTTTKNGTSSTSSKKKSTK